MKKINLLILFSIVTCLSTFSQNNILVIDYNNNFSSDEQNNASNIYNRLLATQASVVRVNAIPATINPATYNQMWIFGNMGTASNAPIVNYMNAGGAVYVQSEVGCCTNEAAFVDQLINATTLAGGSINHTTIKQGNFEFEPNPSLVCNPWTERGSASRVFTGVPANNILFVANNTCGVVGAPTTGDVIGVQFASCDMISGQGALISIGDINVFPMTTACAQPNLMGSFNNAIVIDLVADLLPALLTCGSPVPNSTSISYTPYSYCSTDPNPTPTIIGTTGGTFTIDNSGVINTSTGEINLASSGTGTFNVTYTTGGTCPDTNTVSITINNCSSICDTLCGPNLAPNPGFENTTLNCADTVSEVFTDYSQIQGWYGTACSTCPGNGSTPDYYNSLCNGPAQTNNCGSSNGSMGFFTYAVAGANAREYVQAQLTTPLVAGTQYCVSIDVKTSNGSFAYKPSDGLGLWFTNQMVDIDVQNGGQMYIGPGSLINATPQIENPSGNFIDTNCITVTGTFTATGTEQWVVIGNFRNDANTQFNTTCSFFNPCFGYLIVDDISVRTSCNNTPLPVDLQLSTTNDTICEGSCTTLSANVTGGTSPYIITWDNGLPNGNGPHNVCPTTTTTYTAIVTDSLNDTDTSSITIYVNPTDSNYSAVSICANDSVFAGGNWQNTTGMYYDTLQNTYGCDSLLVTDLTIIPSDTAQFSYSQNNYCITDANPTPTITGTTSGTFTIDNSGVINASTGELNITSSGIGTFNITYTTNGSCSDTNTVTITIVSSGDATITPAGPFCENDAATTLTAAQSGGAWSGNGITNTSTGVFDPSTAGVGTHQIIYTISGSCGDADTISITVNAQEDASFNYSPTTYCSTDANPTPTITGTTGGIFTIDNSGVINASSGELNITSSGVGTFNITYTTNGNCPDTNTVSITINNCTNPIANFTVSDTSICKNECITITDASSNATSWQWTFDGGNPASASTAGPHIICFDSIGTFTITLIATNANGSDTTTSTITVNDNPTVNAGTNVVIDLGQSTLLNATGTNGNYSWTPPTWLDCPTCPSTLSTPNETITYTVVVVDSNGCTASDNVTVIVDFEYVVWVPNIFSPNGDGNNDVVYIRGIGIDSFNFIVYNRWGEKVFETSDLNIGWDGTFRGEKLNSAVFVYYLEATFKNGVSTTKKGDITLVK